MAFSEEFKIKMGIDTSALATGLRGVKNQISNALVGLKHSIGHAVSESFNMLGVPLGVAGLVSQFEKLGEMAEKLRADSEALGVSTGFIQDLQNVGRASGVAGDKVADMIGKFVKGLPAGSDVEKSFFAMADRLANIPDPAERARVAIEAFGKSGIEMIKIAGNGSEELKKLAAGFSKLSDEELRSVDEAKQAFENGQHYFMVGTGKAVHWFKTQWVGAWGAIGSAVTTAFKTGDARAGLHDYLESIGQIGVVEADLASVEKRRAIAKYEASRRTQEAKDALQEYNKHLEDLKFKSGSADEKLQILVRRWNEARQAALNAGRSKDTPGYFKALEKMRDIEFEIADIRKKSDDDHLSKQKQTLDVITRQSKTAKEARQRYEQAFTDRATFSLEEIANMNPGDLNRSARWKVRAAQDVLNSREKARYSFLNNDPARAKNLLDYSDNLASSIMGLNSREQDPTKDLREASMESAQSLKELLAAAKKDGIIIIPRNGK